MNSIRLVVTIVCVIAMASAAIQATTPPRAITCDGATKTIPDGAFNLYSLGTLNQTINFDTLANLMAIRGGGIDLSEHLNVMHMAETALKNATTPMRMAATYFSVWSELGLTLKEEGEVYATLGDNVSAASALLRASNYLQLASRFVEDPKSTAAMDVYTASIDTFAKAVSLEGVPGVVGCQRLAIPYFDIKLNRNINMHGYYCPRRVPHFSGKRPLIIGVNGYDGTAEMQYTSIALKMVDYGYDVIVYEGPGQGYTAKKYNSTFIPNYENATSTVLDYATNVLALDISFPIVWGESFGGYLAPRSFAYEPRFKALVANGGVLDFYQAYLCNMPAILRKLYFSNIPKEVEMFNYYMDKSAKQDMGTFFAAMYAKLGFGTNKFSDLLDQLQEYTNDMPETLAGFQNRSMFVYNPAWDTLTGNQSELFWSKVGPTTASNSMISATSPTRGGGLHCSVGSTENTPLLIARWLQKLFY